MSSVKKFKKEYLFRNMVSSLKRFKKEYFFRNRIQVENVQKGELCTNKRREYSRLLFMQVNMTIIASQVPVQAISIQLEKSSICLIYGILRT